MSTHTQGKWRVAVAGDSPSGGYMIIANDSKVGDLYIAYTIGGLREEEANAEHIVQCVNSHDALVKALTKLLARCERELADPEDVPEIDAARAALSLAGQQGQKT